MQTINRNAPIGIFDSGVGGLTVAKAVSKELPNENIIYFGDTAHLPYGDKSAQAVRQYSVGIVHFLLEHGCKMVIVACNTASAAAYRTLKDYFQDKVLFLDVIEPLAQIIADEERYQKVGIIATKGTVASGAYEVALKSLKPSLDVRSLATPLLVPMIEEGFIHNNISREIIHNYLSVTEFEGIDALLLACTHYPLIRPEIEAYFNSSVQVMDSTEVTAKAAERLLREANALRQDNAAPTYRFFVSDYTDNFEKTTRLFYGDEIHLERADIW